MMTSSFYRNGLNPSAFKELKKKGFGLVDAGARGHLHPAFLDSACFLDVISFEPDPKEYEHLQSGSNQKKCLRSQIIFPVALGKQDKTGELHLCRSGGVSSLLRPNRSFLDAFPEAERFDIVSSQNVQVRSLDSLLKKDPRVQSKKIDFLKVDTQGTTLDVLEGAKQILKEQILGVEVEVEFSEIYEGQSLFRDVDLFLDECGFSLFKLRRFEWSRKSSRSQKTEGEGQLVFGEGLYLRKSLNFLSCWNPKDSREVEATVFIALLFGLRGLVSELISLPQASFLEDISRILRWQRVGHFFRNLKGILSTLGIKSRKVEARAWAREDKSLYAGY
jgi:FkbM family methyltransferase